MSSTNAAPSAFRSFVPEISPALAARAAEFDRSGDFVRENFELLRSVRAFSSMVPVEFGGGGASHRELCDVVRTLAHACPSTALAFSMHAHLVAATVWKVRHGQGGEALLRRVADEQLILLSTGGSDWVDSSCEMTRVEGGYRLDGRKIFGSGSPIADVAITSARYHDPELGWQVLHFPVSLRAEGVRVLDDWDAAGMRGTGSNSIVFEGVFVPEGAIGLTRPAGVWHPVWSLVVTVAFPIFMAAYMGVAERARDLAVEMLRGSSRPVNDDTIGLVGEMENLLATARMAWTDMVERADDYESELSVEGASRTLTAKTILARTSVETVQKAMEAVGGRGFYRDMPFERLLRDVMAGNYHPLPRRKQERFAGRVALGLDPITGEA